MIAEGATSSEPGADSRRQVVRRDGEYWTLEFAGQACCLRDTVGMRHLAYLLVRPHRPIAAFEVEHGGASASDGTGAQPDVDAAAWERARVNVTRALLAVMRRLQAHHPELERHLRATLQTGRYCQYTPDVRVGISWDPVER
jgi:hypothetical protein